MEQQITTRWYITTVLKSISSKLVWILIILFLVLTINKEEKQINSETKSVGGYAYNNKFLPYRNITPSGHGTRGWHENARDYITPYGTPLYAPAVCPCDVSEVGFDGNKNLGKFVDGYDSDLDHLGSSTLKLTTIDGKYEILYMHGCYSVDKDSTILAGDRIGKECSIGMSNAPHTHVSVRDIEQGIYLDTFDFNNTILVDNSGRQIVHTSYRGIYGSILDSYYDANLRISTYNPYAGGINCDVNQNCKTMARGDLVDDWFNGQDGLYALACPQEWPYRTRLSIQGVQFICLDRGGYINCYNVGDFDPTPVVNGSATSKYCWVDALGEWDWHYGEIVSDWGFIYE